VLFNIIERSCSSEVARHVELNIAYMLIASNYSGLLIITWRINLFIKRQSRHGIEEFCFILLYYSIGNT